MFRVAPPLRRWLIAILAVTVGACSNVPARRSIEFFAAFVDPAQPMVPFGDHSLAHLTPSAFGLTGGDAFVAFLRDLDRERRPAASVAGPDFLSIAPVAAPRIWRTFFDTPLVDASGHPVPR